MGIHRARPQRLLDPNRLHPPPPPTSLQDLRANLLASIAKPDDRSAGEKISAESGPRGTFLAMIGAGHGGLDALKPVDGGEPFSRRLTVRAATRTGTPLGREVDTPPSPSSPQTSPSPSPPRPPPLILPPPESTADAVSRLIHQGSLLRARMTMRKARTVPLPAQSPGEEAALSSAHVSLPHVEMLEPPQPLRFDLDDEPTAFEEPLRSPGEGPGIVVTDDGR
ncbi:hypothetical protein BDK51DRAFT_47865 [Blyttiomyces helicus]|uniref:Uncharacterized protein n=1 Tax=Blyttiomyces helicus TaxID=388810 RepID=A0A4P9W2I8_9FUNG|nr:hypothetical protein BDK51DRAFT_47865 [Blyttiomyces helicus]|eukprot:RKO85008.1 hypothetical protein BDK51DRAFT_47865 [Blyttiomyces helicus]